MFEIPDYVPRDFVIAYGADARRRVKRGRPLRARIAYTMRWIRARARDPRAWFDAITSLGLGMLVVSLLGALALAIVNEPLRTLAVALPVIGLTCLALAVVVWQREERPSDAPLAVNR
jgi:hypothetical protein